jgi:hypothetical protein
VRDGGADVAAGAGQHLTRGGPGQCLDQPRDLVRADSHELVEVLASLCADRRQALRRART